MVRYFLEEKRDKQWHQISIPHTDLRSAETSRDFFKRSHKRAIRIVPKPVLLLTYSPEV
jgi:hypothetical protein